MSTGRNIRNIRKFGAAGLWTALALGSFGLAGCGDTPEPIVQYQAPDPGIEAEPKWLAFTCLDAGCDASDVTTVGVIGNRSIAIKRIVLSDRDNADFTVTPSRRPPFILEAGETFELKVSYEPKQGSLLEDVSLRVTYTDGSAQDSRERIEAGELEIPMVRRFIGEPKVTLTPSSINFGAVAKDSSAEVPLVLENSGFGNFGLQIKSISVQLEEGDETEIAVTGLPEFAITPGDAHTVNVNYAPTTEAYIKGDLVIRSEKPINTIERVAIEGTSLTGPVYHAANDLDVGGLGVGATADVAFEVQNRGNEPLILSNLTLSNGMDNVAGLSASFDDGAREITLEPLEVRQIVVSVEAKESGTIVGQMFVTTNEPGAQTVFIPVRGQVQKPTLQVSPGSLDFGAVPQGWVVQERITFTNVGHGTLELLSVDWETPPSQFALTETPGGVTRLEHGESISIFVEFSAQAAGGTAMGVLLINSNDPETPHVDITVEGTPSDCASACVLPHATSDCSSGVCAVGSCDDDYFDLDTDDQNGCECRDANDAGGFCSDAALPSNPSLDDDSSESFNYSGVLAGAEDKDNIKFRAEDNGDGIGIGDNDYGIRIRFVSGPADIEACIFKRRGDVSDDVCLETQPEQCISRYQTYEDERRDGTFDNSDANFRVEIRWKGSSSANTCSSYTLRASNGHGR